jgi:hypothetical protein
MRDTLEELKRLDFSKSSPSHIIDIITDCPVAIVPYIIKGAYILRARRGKGFKERSEMTYCPAQLCTGYQRASLPGETMFYGVISDDQNHQENARAVCASECSTLCAEGMESIGREFFTLSYWKIREPLKVFSLITDTTFPNVQDNKLLNLMRDNYLKIHKDSSDYEKKLAHFISDDFSKPVFNDKEYMISATLTTEIIADMGFDGVVYPSVRLSGQAGLNIALKPSVADAKLDFIQVAEQVFYKNGDHSINRIENVTPKGQITKNQIQFPDRVIQERLGIYSLDDLPIRE